MLLELFKDFNLNSSKKTSESAYFLSTCEYLISNDGSLLISSNQIAEKKLQELPDHFTKFLDQCILITADHGPAVSGAHNSIIAARAGKDIISSLGWEEYQGNLFHCGSGNASASGRIHCYSNSAPAWRI